MLKILPLLAALLLIANARGQERQSPTVSVDFRVNGTAVTMTVPPELTVITDPRKLEAFPYPENQNLYLIMKPISGHESRYIAIGSRPELDAQDISRSTFAAMGQSLAKELNSQTIQKRIDLFASLVDQWRAKKGQPGFEKAKTLEAVAVDDALVTTVIVLNEDGSEFVNCVRLQHVKNRIIVMAVSSPLLTKADIAWVVSVADSLKGCIH
jgi:hypothetical protein